MMWMAQYSAGIVLKDLKLNMIIKTKQIEAKSNS